MKIQITLYCPGCQSSNVVKNGHKSYLRKQNYLCKDCQRQFIGDHNLSYAGCQSGLMTRLRRMFVRGMGIRDIAAVEQISLGKVLHWLTKLKLAPRAKYSHYEELEVDEFWSYVGQKANKIWLIYAYHRTSGEIVAWVFGKRNYKTAKALRKKLKILGISYDVIAIDDWKSFKRAFRADACRIGKEFTKGIEGNNCRLRHRIRRAFRRSCNFSKKLENHIIAFEIAFFYINFGYV
ncbi:IS1 family transposase [Catalinimonas sp. 4WD22]|uniref:IS1 family transposase n=1 Tax=Catalinimonas locisalis TaxID=3133978 RepID=UPI003101A25A